MHITYHCYPTIHTAEMAQLLRPHYTKGCGQCGLYKVFTFMH